MTTNPEVVYRAGVITGRTWRRASQIYIRNPLDGLPTLAIDEEEITQVGDVKTSRYTEMLHGGLDMSGVIDLFDPLTGTRLGTTMPQSTVYIALYSMYQTLAAARDAAQLQASQGNP